MRSTFFLVLVACGALTVIPGSRSLEAKSAHADRPIISHPSVAGGALVSLNDQKLLIWNDRGNLQVSDGVGKWRPLIRVPFERIWSIVADREGFLLTSSTGKQDDKDVVVLFSLEGRELQRWAPEKMIFGLVSDGRRWARTPAGLRELLPDGRLGELIPFLDGEPGRARDLALFERDGKRVVCMTADFSKAHGTHSGCKELAAGGWHFEGMSGSRPILCGPWLIVVDGDKANRIDVRSFATGKLVSQRIYPARASLACTRDGALLVGQQRLEEAQLPSIKPRWSLSVGTQPIREIAALQDYAAYSVRGSNDVSFVRR